MKTDIDVAMTYAHPAERVWAALTSSEALAAWFMPNDFSPAIGHRFSFRARPARALGFDGLGGQLTRRILAGGYPRILGQRLPAYLDQMTSLNVSPAPGQCAEGGRSYVGAFRRWRHIQSR
jgi:hypothetical protein